MSLAVLRSRALNGIDAPPVSVEIHLANGLPAFNIVESTHPRIPMRNHVGAVIIFRKIFVTLTRQHKETAVGNGIRPHNIETDGCAWL